MNIQPDYQLFDFGTNGELINIGVRMRQKMEAIPLPEFLDGKSVLDIGCDFGFWSFLSMHRGALRVTGLDRNRPVKGHGYADIVSMNNAQAARFPRYRNCRFLKTDLGKQWHEYGEHDVLYMFSMYHHVYANCGSHKSIWYWLKRHITPDGELFWENPVDSQDVVVKMNVPDELRALYTEENILEAASEYFDFSEIGGAIHEPYRKVYKFTPRALSTKVFGAELAKGSGGATKAFLHNDGQRIKEIEHTLGIKPYPGSLNLNIPFWSYGNGWYGAEISDAGDRQNINAPWVKRLARFYPLTMNGIECFAFRFEGEKYGENFVELISSRRLSDFITPEGSIIVCR